MHTYRLPHATAIYLLPESEQRDETLARVKAMVATLLKVTCNDGIYVLFFEFSPI